MDKKAGISNLLSVFTILSGISLQGVEQIIMLILGSISLLLSIILSLWRLVLLYKQGELSVEEIEKVKKEVEDYVRKTDTNK